MSRPIAGAAGGERARRAQGASFSQGEKVPRRADVGLQRRGEGRTDRSRISLSIVAPHPSRCARHLLPLGEGRSRRFATASDLCPSRSPQAGRGDPPADCSLLAPMRESGDERLDPFAYSFASPYCLATRLDVSSAVSGLFRRACRRAATHRPWPGSSAALRTTFPPVLVHRRWRPTRQSAEIGL